MSDVVKFTCDLQDLPMGLKQTLSIRIYGQSAENVSKMIENIPMNSYPAKVEDTHFPPMQPCHIECVVRLARSK